LIYLITDKKKIKEMKDEDIFVKATLGGINPFDLEFIAVTYSEKDKDLIKAIQRTFKRMNYQTGFVDTTLDGGSAIILWVIPSWVMVS
jgi:hypothetical protein